MLLSTTDSYLIRLSRHVENGGSGRLRASHARRPCEARTFLAFRSAFEFGAMKCGLEDCGLTTLAVYEASVLGVSLGTEFPACPHAARQFYVSKNSIYL